MGPRRRLLGRHPLKKRVLKNTAAEADQFRLRAAVAFFCVLVGVVGLSFWYFRLQVWQHDDYAMRSEANRVKLRPVVPGRGLIYDRQGRILADNVPAFRIEVTPSEAGDSEDWLPQLAKVVALTPEDIARFEDERRASRGFKPIVLKMRVSDEEVAAFAVDRWRFPGVELVSYLNRRYPYGELFAHVIGYVGRIDTKDQEAMGRSVLTHTGKTGLERSYEEQLRGQIGYEQIETNVDGRPIRQVGHVPAKPGADLRLSIDLDLQRAMVTAFGDMDGSAVAVDPRTGEVLAMVSLPSYDSNLFVNGISNVDYKTLNDDPSRPQFNRNVLGGGPPGSTMKPFMALAGLDSGFRRAEDKTLSTGEFHIAGQKRGYRDSHGGGHGWVDLRESIAQSVNTYYYKLALEMGIDRVDQYMTRYGFGQKTGIDLSGENIGILPSPAWKAKNNKKKEGWYPGETVIAGIGQGYWVVTALQLARGTAAIADGGNLRQLHLVREIRTGYESPWVPKVLQPTTRITDNPGHLQAVHEGMEATIHGGRGTATMMARGAPYRMAGKTGTAQKVSRKGNVSMNPHSLPFHLRHQALFVGYAPADNPTIAVAVVVEHGGYGGSTAAPIARKIFDAWLLGKMPEPIVPKDAPAPTVAPLAANGAAPRPSATSKLGEAAAQAEQDAPKGKPVAVNGAWAESVAQINARVANQPGHTPQVLQGPSMLRPALPGYVPSQTPSEAPRSDDALIEPDLDPEAGDDDDVAPVTAPTTEPRR